MSASTMQIVNVSPRETLEFAGVIVTEGVDATSGKAKALFFGG